MKIMILKTCLKRNCYNFWNLFSEFYSFYCDFSTRNVQIVLWSNLSNFRVIKINPDSLKDNEVSVKCIKLYLCFLIGYWNFCENYIWYFHWKISKYNFILLEKERLLFIKIPFVCLKCTFVKIKCQLKTF